MLRFFAIQIPPWRDCKRSAWAFKTGCFARGSTRNDRGNSRPWRLPPLEVNPPEAGSPSHPLCGCALTQSGFDGQVSQRGIVKGCGRFSMNRPRSKEINAYACTRCTRLIMDIGRSFLNFSFFAFNALDVYLYSDFKYLSNSPPALRVVVDACRTNPAKAGSQAKRIKHRWAFDYTKNGAERIPVHAST